MTNFSDDDPRFDLVDDPFPPEPDAAVFERVVARGRQRQNRRRAVFGGIGVALVAVLLSGGVAAAQHHNAGPNVNVQGPGEFVAPDSTSTTVALSGPTPTTIGIAAGPGRTVPSGAPTLPLPPGTQEAQVGDFSGEVTVDRPIVTADDLVAVQLVIRNVTDHVVDVEGSVNVALVCANDLTAGGETSAPLHFENPDANIFWVIAPPLDPGEQSGIGPMTVQTTVAEVGTVTCEAMLIRSNSDSGTFTSLIVGRLENIAAVSYTVLPVTDSSSTTTTTDVSTTTTTLPQ